MSNQSLAHILPGVQRLLGESHGSSDAHLLGRFLSGGDAEAFSELVRRHGPMVLAACRRLLPDAHDVDDVFQATFLVLIRKAGSIRRREQLANWLYGVACRAALKVRTQNARRHGRERPLGDVPVDGDAAELVWRELRPLLDEELHRLPEKYRTPVVLCYLEGISKREAARRLGWPEGTLSIRLHRAREILRGRLTRRGVTLSVGVVVAALSECRALGAVPASLLTATVGLASSTIPGQATAASARITAVSDVLVNASWRSRKLLVLLGATALLTAAVFAVVQVFLGPPAPSPGNEV